MELISTTKFLGLTAPHLLLVVSWPKLEELAAGMDVSDVVVAGAASFFGRGVYIVTKCFPILALAFQTRKTRPKSKYASRMANGLAFSAIGDIFLGLEGEAFFAPGLGSFLIAHLFYIGAIESRKPSKRWILGGALLTAAAAITRKVILPHVQPAALEPAVVVYVATLVSMLWRAAAIYVDLGEKSGVDVDPVMLRRERRKAGYGLLGALSFVVSDFVLAYTKFVGPVPHRQLIVMGTYYAAQLGIASSDIALGKDSRSRLLFNERPLFSVPENLKMTQSIESEPVVAQTEVPAEAAGDQTFLLSVQLPQKAGSLTLAVVPAVTIQDIRQMILEAHECQFYTCFNIEFDGKKLDDVLDLASIEGFTPTSVLNMVEAPYTDREVRIHLTRFREVLSNFQSTTPSLGMDVGVSYLSTLSGDHPIYGTPKTEASNDKANRKPVVKAETPNKVASFADYKFEDSNPDVVSLIPELAVFQGDNCVKSLGVSMWNPPPHYRRMAGDHLYLSVLTVEGVALQITCNVSGFYISRSTDKIFDPLPRASKPCFSHTLPGLLTQASLGFANRFPILQASIQARHPFEYLLSPVNYFPWCVRPAQHEADPGRALDSVLIAADALELMASRDWNEDIQSARELPRSTHQDRVLRDQMLHRHHTEFVDAASRGAVSIVSGSVPSINPADPESSRMYIHGGIFFSHGNDQRESYERFGGAGAAHVAVGKDVDGIAAVAALDIEGLYTLGTAVVDYKGCRLVAQTIIPGILKKQQQQQQLLLEAEAAAGGVGEGEEGKGEEGGEGGVVGAGENALVKYGSIDNGKTIASSPSFQELAEKVARALHLSEHVVVDGEGQKHTLFTSVDTKGITGEDGRRYLLDLSRVTPVDIEFLDQVDKEASEPAEGDATPLPAYPHRMTLLRTELVEMYHDTKLRAYINEQAEKRKEALEKEAAERKERGEEGEIEEKPLEINFDMRFNPDAFVLLPAAPEVGGEDPESEVTTGERDVVRQMSKFLSNNLVSSTALELAAHPASCPIDGQRLTKFLHFRGVNMRYLGKITSLLEKLRADAKPFFAKMLCQEEMVTRAAKVILRDLLRDTPVYLMSNCVSHFLNCLFADPSTPAPPIESLRPEGYKLFGSSEPLTYELLTPAVLDQRIREEVRARFRYDGLPRPRLFEGTRRVPVLRAVCLKVGIQLLARERAWGAGFECFGPADVVNVYPVVKHAEPRSAFGDELQENGLYSLRQGQNQLGVDLLAEASSVYEQVFTPIHPESGRSYRNLAMIQHEKGDIEACKMLQRKSIIVSERTSGFDDPETCQQFMNLGYFECLSGNSDAGFRYMRHALRSLEMLCSGNLHPELASADTQIAMMLTHCKRDMSLATRFHSRAVAINEAIFGKDHEITARSYEHLCQGLMAAGDFRAALEAQRVVYRHVKLRAGDEETDAVKEAAGTLALLTQRAVLDAKREKETKATTTGKPNGGKGSNGKKSSNGSSNGGKKSSLPTAAAAADLTSAIPYGSGHMKSRMSAQIAGRTAGSITGSKGHLSVDELVRFIDDGGSGKKKRGGKGVSAVGV
ncbi:Intracellular distribution of mitochondria [Dinochytrium kinnereticum]|nr:Intracellular distribution of mitochondria [Dinochytrium kinnereticum]